MDFSLGESVSAITVFVQGLLSFFSPCVLPLLPLYIGYLAGGALKRREDGTFDYPRGKVLINTIFFVIGVSFAFFLLGAGFTALGQFFHAYQQAFSIAAGIIMVVFGLYMLGVFGQFRVVETERRLPFNLNKFAMNPLVALALGFTFSFAWTPCIGPVLTSVLLMASSSASAFEGFLLIGVYTLGFILPFLAVGLFTGEVLRFFRTHGNVVKYTVKAGGALLIVMGLLTATGWMNGVSRFFASVNTTQPAIEQTVSTDAEDATLTSTPGQKEAAHDEADITASASNDIADENSDDTNDLVEDVTANDTPEQDTKEDTASASSQDLPAMPYADTEFVDQYGNTLTLEQFRGKTIFLNFFATWCGPCQAEMPDIQALYEEYGENEGELVVLGVANPNDGSSSAADGSIAEVTTFLRQSKVTYPVLMDTQGLLFSACNISAFPTTIMITKDGAVFGQVVGGLTSEMMHSIVEQTISGER